MCQIPVYGIVFCVFLLVVNIGIFSVNPEKPPFTMFVIGWLSSFIFFSIWNYFI
jgi:hypothetical protein